jgi:hypothetical protein
LKLSTEPDRSMPRAAPAPAAEVVVLIAPAEVNARLKELPVSAIGSTGPCQTPWKATTRPWGSCLGVPPVSSMLVREPLVVYQPCTAPVRSKV